MRIENPEPLRNTTPNIMGDQMKGLDTSVREQAFKDRSLARHGCVNGWISWAL
jgi:hypothetical protein